MIKKKILLSAFVAAASFTGCGSSSGGSSIASSQVQAGSAFYVDSAVEGVTVQCGGSASVTNNEGRFTYGAEGNCIFTIGNLVLRNESGITEGKIILEENIRVAQLLQSLDNDNDPTNGITIDPKVSQLLAQLGIETVPTTDGELAALINTVQDSVIEFSGEFVDAAEAEYHLNQTRVELYGAETPSTPQTPSEPSAPQTPSEPSAPQQPSEPSVPDMPQVPSVHR